MQAYYYCSFGRVCKAKVICFCQWNWWKTISAWCRLHQKHWTGCISVVCQLKQNAHWAIIAILLPFIITIIRKNSFPGPCTREKHFKGKFWMHLTGFMRTIDWEKRRLSNKIKLEWCWQQCHVTRRFSIEYWSTLLMSPWSHRFVWIQVINCLKCE